MKKPRIDEQAVVADGAVVLGDVTIEKDVSIWYNAVIRGDVNSISIGEGTNIQDLAVLHVDADASLAIGKNVTIGHGAILHGCTIKDQALIGMGAIVLNGAKIAFEMRPEPNDSRGAKSEDAPYSMSDRE